MNKQELIQRALNKDFLSAEEGQFLFENVATTELMWAANELRQKAVPGDVVTWQIDRNVNTTNACVANCKFCNFFYVFYSVLKSTLAKTNGFCKGRFQNTVKHI